MVKENLKKIGIVITDGVGYRNFVLSYFLDELSKVFDCVYLYSGLPKDIYTSLPHNVELRELPVFKERKITWFFRKWKEVAHLQRYKVDNYGIRYNLSVGYPTKISFRAILVKWIYFITKYVHTNTSIQWIEKIQFATFSQNKTTKAYIKLLEQDKPTHLFFTHQRPPFLAPFLYAGQKLNIKVSSFIFSWDNLSSKGRMLGTFDYFLVWSHLMKKELLYFYPHIKPDNIQVVGTPQFEPYVIPEYRLQKDTFCNKFGLDSGFKTICYSCADSSIGKNDPIVIATIAKAIREQRLKGEIQILVRTSPAEGAERFDEVKRNFPEIIWNHPRWVLARKGHAEDWSQRVPDVDDVKDLRGILEYCDLGINMLSTMSLDFMLFDKPVINTVFGDGENGLYNDQRFLKYGHLEVLVNSGAVTIAKNKVELINQINEALGKSNLQ